jgi:hypothetical protein
MTPIPIMSDTYTFDETSMSQQDKNGQSETEVGKRHKTGESYLCLGADYSDIVNRIEQFAIR